MDKRSKIKLMRRRKKLFPWLRPFFGKYSQKFFSTENFETLEYLFQKIDEEIEFMHLELNTEKAEEFFSILNAFFLHFWWQMRWKSSKKWRSYWKKIKSPEVSTNSSHGKYCVQLLYYMILVSIYLTGGDEKSDWIERILTAVKSLPDAVDILYSALLRISDLKKKHKPVYFIILKHVLCCETFKDVAEPQTYCKVILLFRRLIKLTKDKEEKSQFLLFALKLKVPSDIQLWLSSQNIEESNDLNYDNLTQELLLRSYPDELLRKVSEILIEHDNCKRKPLIVDDVNVHSDKTNVYPSLELPEKSSPNKRKLEDEESEEKCKLKKKKEDKILKEELEPSYKQGDCNSIEVVGKTKSKRKKVKKSKSKTKKKEQNHSKQSKKKKSTSISNPDEILKINHFLDAENHLRPTKIQNKKLKKHSKEKGKKSAKHRKIIIDPNTIKVSSESENFSSQTGSNELDKFNDSDGKKFKRKKQKDKFKKTSEEECSSNFTEGIDSASLEEENAVDKPKVSPKLKKKKLFNYDLYCLESQKEIQSNRTTTSNGIISSNITTFEENSLLNNNEMTIFSDVNNCTDMPSTNLNVNSNLPSFEDTAEYSDVSISELLKLPKVQIYRHNAALGIENKYTSKFKKKGRKNSKDFENETTGHTELINEGNFSGSGQESNPSSFKNDLLLASKKILKQSCDFESCSSPSLFDDELVTEKSENNDKESTESMSFHISNEKESVIINSNSVCGTCIPEKGESTAVSRQSLFMNSSEDILLSMDSSSEQTVTEELNIQRSSEYSFDSLSNSSLNLFYTQNASALPIDSNFNHHTESCEVHSSTSPSLIQTTNNVHSSTSHSLIQTTNNVHSSTSHSLIQTTNNVHSSTSPSLIQTTDNILSNELQSELVTKSVPHSPFGSSVTESKTNESRTQCINIDHKSPNYKSVGIATDIISSTDFAVNCNMNDNSSQNSKKLSSIQVIINFTGEGDQSASKRQQLVANFNFQSPVFINPVSSSEGTINNNLNLTPNYHPLHMIPLNQASNFIEESSHCGNCSNSNVFCKSKEIGQYADIGDNNLNGNLFNSSNATIVNNSFSKTESHSNLSTNPAASNYNKEASFNTSLYQDVNLKELTAENLETLNRKSSEHSLAAKISTNNSSYRTSTIYSDASDDNSSCSSIASFSEFQTELEVGENLEIGASPKTSNYRRNNFQVDSEPESSVTIESTEPSLNLKVEPSKEDNAKSKKCSEEDGIMSKSTSRKRKTPKKIISPGKHSYNLRVRKGTLTPKALYDYIAIMEEG